MAQELGALAFLVEDLALIPRIQYIGSQASVTPVSENPMPSPGLLQ